MTAHLQNWELHVGIVPIRGSLRLFSFEHERNDRNRRRCKGRESTDPLKSFGPSICGESYWSEDEYV